MNEENELTLQQVKEKLLKLSEKGLISKTSFQIKKMNELNCRIELKRYEQKIMAQTAEKIKGIIFDSVSNGLSYLEVIDDADKNRLEEELKSNHYLQEEVVNISKGIAPWIPYIGLTLAAISIGKFAYTRYLRSRDRSVNGDATQVSKANEKATQTQTVNKQNVEPEAEGGAKQNSDTTE